MTRLLAEVRYGLGMARVHFSYWIRPFDMIADRRRWRWQPSAPCGRAQLAALPPETRVALEAIVQGHVARRDDTGRGGAT